MESIEAARVCSWRFIQSMRPKRPGAGARHVMSSIRKHKTSHWYSCVTLVRNLR